MRIAGYLAFVATILWIGGESSLLAAGRGGGGRGRGGGGFTAPAGRGTGSSANRAKPGTAAGLAGLNSGMNAGGAMSGTNAMRQPNPSGRAPGGGMNAGATAQGAQATRAPGGGMNAGGAMSGTSATRQRAAAGRVPGGGANAGNPAEVRRGVDARTPGAGAPGAGIERGAGAGAPGVGVERGAGVGVAGVGRTNVGVAGAGAGRWGTEYRSRADLGRYGTAVNRDFGHYDAFRPDWYAHYPNAWHSTAWVGGSPWGVASWPAAAAYMSMPSQQPVYYDYGTNVVQQGDTAYVNGDPVGTTAHYASQAATLAHSSEEVETAPDQEWMPLGVFAMVEGDETNAQHLFQIAVNRDGVLRGNYYDALTETTEPLEGAVDKQTGRAAWTVAKRKTPIYDVGIANLTQNETTMLVHYNKEKSSQFTLVRIDPPSDAQAAAGSPTQ